MVPNFTCTTPPDLRPHIDFKAALPTVAPLKERCLETEGKQWETESSANKFATNYCYEFPAIYRLPDSVKTQAGISTIRQEQPSLPINH